MYLRKSNFWGSFLYWLLAARSFSLTALHNIYLKPHNQAMNVTEQCEETLLIIARVIFMTQKTILDFKIAHFEGRHGGAY